MEIGIFKEDNKEDHLIINDLPDGNVVFSKTTKEIKWIKDKIPDDIEFNDEIVSIELIGDDYCVDIEVSDDHLFVANDVLTKNSKALVDTTDFLVGIIYPEELREQQLQIWKILKNRFGGTVNYKIPIRTEHNKSKVYDVEDSELQQQDIIPEPPKKKNNEINMKFKDSQLDENLWDD